MVVLSPIVHSLSAGTETTTENQTSAKNPLPVVCRTAIWDGRSQFWPGCDLGLVHVVWGRNYAGCRLVRLVIVSAKFRSMQPAHVPCCGVRHTTRWICESRAIVGTQLSAGIAFATRWGRTAGCRFEDTPLMRCRGHSLYTFTLSVGFHFQIPGSSCTATSLYFAYFVSLYPGFRERRPAH